MLKKTFFLPFVFSVIALLLSSCGGSGGTSPASTENLTASATVSVTETQPSATETLAATQTLQVPSETATSTPPPQDTPTPAPTATLAPPQNAVDCTNAAKFVSDITVPDNSNLPAGEKFTKTWRVQNTGTCTWWSGYTLTHYSELKLNAPKSVPLPRTNPGETADISVELTAPETAGSYRGNFVIRNPKGLIMEIEGDSRLWVIFNAVDEGKSPPIGDATPAADNGGETASGAENTEGAMLDQAACAFTLDSTRPEGVLAAINAYRAQSGLPPYTMNAALAHAAQSHAADMACNQLFFHNGSDGSTPQTRAAAAGYIGKKVTENVYGSYPPLTPEEVKEWWRLDQVDPMHNKNLISSEYAEVGIGYAFFNNFGYYVVLFGMP